MEEYIIPALAAVVVAVIEAIAAKERKQTKIEAEKANARAALAGIDYGTALPAARMTALGAQLAGLGINLGDYAGLMGGVGDD